MTESGPMTTRILVTGGHGFLGRWTVDTLRRTGAEVTAPSHRSANLLEQAEVRGLFMGPPPNIVVHLAAACGGIGANVLNPGRFLYENALMGLNLLEASRQAGVERFVLISTTCAYPQDAPIPLHEASFGNGPPTAATGPYGLAKRLLHEACATYERQYGFDSVVLVPANLYGPGDHYEDGTAHVLAALVRRYDDAVRQGLDSVTHWGTGRPTREFMHVRDCALAITLACDLGRRPGVSPMNIGTGRETSIAELAALVAAEAGYRGETLWDESKPDGQPRRCLDVQAARERLGFEAATDLVTGINETMAAYRSRA